MKNKKILNSERLVFISFKKVYIKKKKTKKTSTMEAEVVCLKKKKNPHTGEMILL